MRMLLERVPLVELKTCDYCHGSGENEHGNECEFCDGTGSLEIDEYVYDDNEDEGVDDNGQDASTFP